MCPFGFISAKFPAIALVCLKLTLIRREHNNTGCNKITVKKVRRIK